MHIKSKLSSWIGGLRKQASSTKPPTDIFGRLLPYNEPLENTAARFNVWGKGPAENDRQLARRAALAICESLERQSQVTAELERDLDIVLAFDRSSPCAS